MKTLVAFAAGPVALVLTVACSSPTAPDRSGTSTPTPSTPSIPSVAGNWRGTFVLQGLPNLVYNWLMPLTQSGSRVSGDVSCSITGASGGPYAVSGTVDTAGNLSLSYAVSGCQVTMNARVSGTSLSGAFVSSGACACFGSSRGDFREGTWTGTRP